MPSSASNVALANQLETEAAKEAGRFACSASANMVPLGFSDRNYLTDALANSNIITARNPNVSSLCRSA